MTPADEPIEAQALEWLIRIERPEFSDWDGLTDWMTADERHASCFNDLARRDDAAAEALRSKPMRDPVLKETLHRPVIHRHSWHWQALAAGLALALSVGGAWVEYGRVRPSDTSSIIAFQTRSGETRDLALKDGTRIAIAPETVLKLDKSGRGVTLDRGQATFAVAHDPAKPFHVTLGDIVVTDVGTRFDIDRRPGRTLLAVSEGQVSVDGAGAPLFVTAGHELILSEAGNSLSAIEPALVGSWRHGLYNYRDASLAEVATDIMRATGAHIVMSPQTADKRFGGSIQIGGDAGRTLHDVAPILGVKVARRGTTWVLGPSPDADRT